MKGKLLLFMAALAAGTVTQAQSLDATMQQAKVGVQDNNVAQASKKAGIRLNPSNRFNATTPAEVSAWRLANGEAAATVNKAPAKTNKIAVAEEYPDSLNCYGVLNSNYKTENEGLSQLHAYSWQTGENLSFHKTMQDAELPSATTYVRKGNEWYCFTNSDVTVVNATSGEKVKTVAYDLGGATLRRAGGTYNPADGLFYIGTWSGIYSVSAEDFTAKKVCDIPGYLLSVAAGPDGVYLISWTNKSLYKINTEEGTTELIAENLNARTWQNQGQSSAFDWATNTLYISMVGSQFYTYLDKFDMTTKTASKGFSFPGKETTMMGLYIPFAADDAPAAPTQIACTEGVLSFLTPSKTYRSGKDLTGELTAYITVDGVEKTFTVTAGQMAQLDLGLGNGAHEIFIEIGNEAGRSPERVTRPFIGQDVPSAVTDLTLDTDDNVNMHLAWTAPTTSMNGGPVDDSQINYHIVRYPDNVVVCESTTETSFTELIPETHQRYYYAVTARNGQMDGGVRESNIVPAGKVWEPPYTEEFRTQADFDFFTVYDGNADGQTWKHMQPNNQEELGMAYMNGNGITSSITGYVATYDNDWLVTPSIRMKKGNDYRLAFNVGNHLLNCETMEILLGTSNDTTSVMKTIAPTYTMPGEGESYTYIFDVPEDGLYNVFFHVNTIGNSCDVEIDNLSIDLYANFEGPDSVQNLTATAGDKGELLNALTFTTPTKTYKQEELKSISYINIYRNGETEPTKVFENPEMGKQLTWIDTDVEQGYVSYRVVAFNEKGQGREALSKNWVGLDVPATPLNVKSMMNSDYKAVVTWDKVGEVGTHGGYVNPEDVKYLLKRYNEYNYSDHWEACTDSTTALTLTDESYEVTTQTWVDYVVVASNSAGTSEGAGTGLVLGQPYARPYAESFPKGEASLAPWTLSASSYNYAWTIDDGAGLAVKPYDGDDGMLKFTYLSEESNTQVIMAPRVSLEGATSPELSFFMYHGFEAEADELVLDVYANYDDEGWKIIEQVPYNNGTDGWGRYSIPLRSGVNNVQYAFAATAVDASASIYIDNIKIDESVEKDLTIQSFSATKRLEQGETGTATVNVANYGTKTADSFSVVLLKDGSTYATQNGADLAQNGVQTFSFELPTTKADAGSTFVFQARVLWADDLNANNDRSQEVKQYVHGSSLPTAGALKGEADGADVTLSWEAPATNEVPDAITDDFEAYENFIIENIGDWTTYDGDASSSTVSFSGTDIAHRYEPMAWQVYNPSAAGFNLQKYDVIVPHSGDKYLASWAAVNDSYTETIEQDDWLISSEVTGGTDISFYYRVPNTGSDPQIFEIMYSTDSKTPAEFVKLDRDSVANTTDWVKFEYTLPAEAKYFAIRNRTKGSYTVAFLDDVTYTPLYGSTTELTLKGYNVYRDNELVGTVDANTKTFNETLINSGEHEYNVTAVWDKGESNYTNNYLCSVVTGISKQTTASSLVVKGGKNQLLVSGANGQVSIYSAAGQTVANLNVEGSAVVTLPAGVYVVAANGTTAKVVVK